MLPAEGQHTASLKSVACFLFLFSPARLRLLILLMSGNVHPNPGPVFPCSVRAGNVTWRGKSVQCCTCSKWVHPRCSTFPLQIQNSCQLSLLEVLPTPVGRTYSTGSSLTSSPSMILTHSPFYIAPPLTSPLLPPLLSFHAPGR